MTDQLASASPTVRAGDIDRVTVICAEAGCGALMRICDGDTCDGDGGCGCECFTAER